MCCDEGADGGNVRNNTCIRILMYVHVCSIVRGCMCRSAVAQAVLYCPLPPYTAFLNALFLCLPYLSTAPHFLLSLHYFTASCTILLSYVLFHCPLSTYFTIPCTISLSPILNHYPLHYFTIPCTISLSPALFHYPLYHFTISNSHSLQVCHEMLGQKAHQAPTWRGFSI